MKRDAIDFHVIEPGHVAIHIRLENWAAWANGRPAGIVQPMFALYRPDSYERESSMVIDKLDAQRMQKGVAALPAGQRSAVTWQYLSPCAPGRMARALAVSLSGLQDLVRTGRTMLINRRV